MPAVSQSRFGDIYPILNSLVFKMYERLREFHGCINSKPMFWRLDRKWFAVCGFAEPESWLGRGDQESFNLHTSRDETLLRDSSDLSKKTSPKRHLLHLVPSCKNYHRLIKSVIKVIPLDNMRLI